MTNVRTDLALEAKEIYQEKHRKEKDIDGIEVINEIDNDIKVTTVKVKDENGARKIGKPKGNYVTIDIPEFTAYDGETMDRVSQVVSEILGRMINIDVEKTALVVGLGNWKVTPDALGPKVTEGIMVTRHLKTVMPEIMDDSVRPVCSIAPGVLGITGVETVEIIKGTVERVKPDVVICIDALAARRVERVNTTIQIGDTGISPGAGVGNNRKQINEDNLGVKVIAIGVPTVVDAVTIANDTIDMVVDSLMKNSSSGNDFYKMLGSLDKNEKSSLIREVLSSKSLGEMIVTPKDIDLIINSLAKIISNGINMAVQPNMDMEDINKFMS
ncbi:GPR endopeptidase [Clostridium butyricum]|uniref:Germination protease n=1 Tax=Clostridium butyricum E4 str. BoNT E BL5262 TaxID=632245 RepID=C4IDG9_CLOBU|nr:GPR endopeptidase [Clostridium butyricum]EDT75366.1 spore protease [Clostridium butyricum 5521]EEP55335.1 GPR endopeptidase [Clostridium butyricum E4 str. BoNT E BL5262]MBS5982575.1 GPR endopeptidase [Clostridium butyricum]MDB2153625.1 GPR endopeptidase [Clostridium butyricum]NFL31257.1 GPR endopeptidase [Clostridium butyricum]